MSSIKPKFDIGDIVVEITSPDLENKAEYYLILDNNYSVDFQYFLLELKSGKMVNSNYFLEDDCKIVA
jgi:hypothetical protein